jgi:3-methyladenine DNA glycosylase AlkD
MGQHADLPDSRVIASEIVAEIRALPVKNTPNARTIRRKYSQKLKKASPEFILELARELFGNHDHRWLAYEFIGNHRAAFQSIGEAELEEFGQGINDWAVVDCFGRILAGPAWLSGQVSDELIHKWAHSEDRWWRRAALVSTVALNVKASGGSGDTERTLEICRILVDDHDDMVVKALSWALRELVPHDPEAVRGFLAAYEERLAARVKREVRSKLTTGLKNPKRKRR